MPSHVVYRVFPQETVVLNIDSGQYHGLNATAGRMLEALEKADVVRDALVALEAEWPGSGDRLERDLCRLCIAFHRRGLIELDEPAP